MKNKSIVNIKRGLADDITAGRLSYGAIIAESYWKTSPDGFIQESQPTTSEIIDGLFYPFKVTIKNGGRLFINNWFTNCRIEQLNTAGGVHVERIVLKPDLDAPEAPPGFIRRECWSNFKQHWSAND